MPYTQEDYEADVKTALRCAEKMGDCTGRLKGLVVASEVFKCFMGDKKLKRELQILLDKFVEKYEYTVSAQIDEASSRIMIPKRLRYLAEMIVAKFSAIDIKLVRSMPVGEHDFTLFVNSAKKFMTEIQDRIDVM